MAHKLFHRGAVPNPKPEREQHRLFPRGKIEVRFSSGNAKINSTFFLYHECFGKSFILMLAGCARRGLSGGPQIGATRWTQFWVHQVDPILGPFFDFRESHCLIFLIAGSAAVPFWGPPGGPQNGSVIKKYVSKGGRQAAPVLGPLYIFGNPDAKVF